MERWLLASPKAPRAFFDTFVPIMQARAIMTAVETGLFAALRDGPLDVVDMARVTAVDQDTLDLLLSVLTASDYLTVDAERRFALSALSRATLLADSPASLTSWVSLTDMWWTRFADMTAVLRSGRGGDLHAEQHGARQWQTYQAAMLEHARNMAPEIAELIPVRPGSRRLLDIGGSHGLFGALVARAHPPLLAEVLDLPPALEHARELARKEGLTDVVTHRAGDALVDDLGVGYDVIFLGSVIHHFDREQIARLLVRVRAAIAPKGTVAVYGMNRPEVTEGVDLLRDAFALFFRIVSSAASYTVAEQQEWLASVGFVDLEAHPYPLGMTLLVGRAP